MDGIYLNISKAFDTVSSDILASKWVWTGGQLVTESCLDGWLKGWSEWPILYLEASNKWSAAGMCPGTCPVSHPQQWHHGCTLIKFRPNGCTIPSMWGQVCHPEGPGHTEGMGQQECPQIQHGWMPHPALWKEQSLVGTQLVPSWLGGSSGQELPELY